MVKHQEYCELDVRTIRDALRQPIVIDGRNTFDAARMRELGFLYRSVGQGNTPS